MSISKLRQMLASTGGTCLYGDFQTNEITYTVNGFTFYFLFFLRRRET